MPENTDSQGPVADHLSPLEPRPTLSIPELQAGAKYANEKFVNEPEFQLTKNLETRNAMSLFEAVARGELTTDEAAHLIGARVGEVRMASDVDYLTDLYNKGGGTRRLIETLYAGSRNGSRTTIMMIDLDGFKEVNDKLGHDAGDRAIQATGGHLSTTIRGSDVAFRYGGDEFGVIFPNTDITSARIVAKKLTDGASDAISSATEAFGYTISNPVTFSAGLAEEDPLLKSDLSIPEKAQKLSIMADRAAQLAKHLGKNRIVIARDAEGIVTYTDLSEEITYMIEINEKGEISGKKKL